MKVRSGIDMCGIARIGKLLDEGRETFFEKCFTPYENETVRARSAKRQPESYAARYAAKEAAAKALGTGICTDGIGFHDFEVRTDASGAPVMVFLGKALEKSRSMGVISVSLSLTHEKDYAAAVCTLLTDEED